MVGVTRLRLPNYPCHPPPTHPPAQTLIHAIPDITATVKNVAQNPAVLAS